MKRIQSLSLVGILALCAISGWASKKPQSDAPQAFTGEIMDTLCVPYHGHEHMMQEMKSMGTDKQTCIKQCLLLGAKYALYDPAKQTVYRIDDKDKDKVEPFAGRQVQIKGTLNKKTLKVNDIQAAQ